METENLKEKLDELRTLPKETEWVEFKQAEHSFHFDKLGKYFSALSNEANLKSKEYGWLIFGVTDKDRRIIGTQYRSSKSHLDKLKSEIANHTTNRITFMEIHELPLPEGRVIMFQIPAAPKGIPIAWQGVWYGRDDEALVPLNIWELEQIRNQAKREDWSAQICEDATINDLDSQAILKAREEYRQKFPAKTDEIDSWNDMAFLNKAKLTRQNKITRAAIILLGKEEAEHFISPSVARITWILRDVNNHDKDYEHFGPPCIINVGRVLSKIRNLKYRYLPDETLFPIEVTQYDPWVIREALHNCIAHQDYELKGKINIVERPDELIFDNVGSFIPGSVEAVITQDSPPEIYRNHFLVGAMFNLNMIDTIGGGIKKMFQTQTRRFFPLPDYDLTQHEKVIVKIAGKELNENYTRLLIKNPNMDLTTVMLLDKVQKGIGIPKDAHKSLKSQKLVEGRYPRLFVSSSIAAAMREKAKYIKYRAFDDQQYKNMIIAFIKRYGSASREEIDDLLLKKLSDVLSEKQKQNKISNLLYAMSKKDKIIKNDGSRRVPKWVISN